MTLTLLLQLTSEEQLYAQQIGPVVLPQTEEQVAPAPAVVPDEDCADWAELVESAC